MLSQEYVNEVLTDGGYYQLMSDEIFGAENDWLSLLAAKPEIMGGAIPREKSMFLNRRIVERICDALDGHPKVAIRRRYWTAVVTINNEIVLRFKKLNEKFRTSNIKTRRVVDLWHRNRPLGGEFERWINVTFGWQMDRTGMIAELALVNELGNRPEWIIRLVDEGVVQALQTQSQFTITNIEGETPVFVAKVRDTKRALDISGSDETTTGTST